MGETGAGEGSAAPASAVVARGIAAAVVLGSASPSGGAVVLRAAARGGAATGPRKLEVREAITAVNAVTPPSVMSATIHAPEGAREKNVRVRPRGTAPP